MALQVLLFLLFGAGAIGTALAVISRRNPVASALWMVAYFLTLAGIYLTLQAQFIAVIQVLIYAGAIMVLMVFVIMLLNLGNPEQLRERFNPRVVLATALGALLVLQLLVYFVSRPTGFRQLSPEAARLGTTEAIGSVLFTDYLFPFEAVSLLLLSAVVGAVILAKRKLEG
ncbi:MAG: NADH-quinone oxidoreductase subunit J [Chlorobiota bacterium]|nr:NADH-quinone oxidoreductase subunit J [Chlorobiota bacterium]